MTSCRPSINKSLTYFKRTISSHRNYAHALEYLRELDSPAVDSRLNRTLGNLQKINDLLIAQFFNVTQNHTCSKIRRKPVDTPLNLLAEFSSFDLALY